MVSRVQKWGNSLAIRIPKPFAAEVGLDEDTAVEVTIDGGRLVIEPASRRAYRLSELLERVTRSNRHAESDWGEAQGREAW